MLDIDSTIENLPKTTKPLAAALKKLGIGTARDLLLHFPYRYLDFSRTSLIKDLAAGENVTVKAAIKSIASRFSFRGRLPMAEAVVSDESGSIKVIWFNQSYLAKALKAGDEIFLAGAPEYYNFSLQLTNPLYEKVSDFPVHTARLVPLYHLGQKIYPKTFRNLMAGVLHLASDMPEILPEQILKSQKLLDIAQTVRASHFPKSLEDISRAKQRLAFEEIFLNQLSAQRYKLRLSQKKAHEIKFDQALIKTFVARLPFQLTNAQKKAAWEILQDLERPSPMNRLLEGDVGSGKTAVALLSALEASAAGLQAALLAPTEILAIQHFETAKKLFTNPTPKFNVRVSLLTTSFSKKNGADEPRKDHLRQISEGMPGLYVGTHALLEKKVEFKNLALVIVDEQHRFGVEQRAELIQRPGKVPHLLSLSATPIPRTLQLAYFGELDISRIKSKPVGRKPIVTRLVQTGKRGAAYEFISKQVQAGRQAFVITPLIEESESVNVKAAKTEAGNLQKIFPQFKIGLLHGRMKGADKEKIMGGFLENKINILVSTSVVEVGVDVPNASVMLIEGAERFGLAQLHQFRGRVGRAEHQSYCLLFTENQNLEVLARLQDFAKTQDGFALAELDLKQRGFGELYGSLQSGWNFKYFNPSYINLIEPARGEAKKILENDINLQNYPKLREKIEDKIIHFE